jgi:hypothetical protein
MKQYPNSIKSNSHLLSGTDMRMGLYLHYYYDSLSPAAWSYREHLDLSFLLGLAPVLDRQTSEVISPLRLLMHPQHRNANSLLIQNLSEYDDFAAFDWSAVKQPRFCATINNSIEVNGPKGLRNQAIEKIDPVPSSTVGKVKGQLQIVNVRGHYDD